MAISEKQISELEQFFAGTKLPKSLQLIEGTTISDTAKFVCSHLEVLRNNVDKPMYEVFYQRLIKLKQIVSDSQS